MTLLDDLHDTAESLLSGWPIDRLNRARRAKEATMSDRTDEILDRLTAAHDVIDMYTFTHGADGDFDDALDVIDSLRDLGASNVTELVDTFASLTALLSDAGSELARLNAENAGLRARCGK